MGKTDAMCLLHDANAKANKIAWLDKTLISFNGCVELIIQFETIKSGMINNILLYYLFKRCMLKYYVSLLSEFIWKKRSKYLTY